MALKISKNNGLTDIVSDANPITSEHPLAGSTVETRLFLYNDQSTKRYENITIDPVDTTGGDESTWVFLAPDNAGSPGTFLAASAPLTMANISDSNVAKPFWVRVVVPAQGDTVNKNDIKLKVDGKEYAV